MINSWSKVHPLTTWRWYARISSQNPRLSFCWSHGQILRQGSRDITTHNRSEKKSVSMGTTVRSKQPERCGRTAALCTQNLAQTLSSWLHSHFLLTRTTLTLLKSWTNSSTRESGHHHTQPLWKEISLNGDNSPKQAAGTMRKNCSFCALKTLRNLCPADFIHPFYSHSYDSHSAEVTDKFFDKGVGTSHTQPLWKDIGLNGDNSDNREMYVVSVSTPVESTLVA